MYKLPTFFVRFLTIMILWYFEKSLKSPIKTKRISIYGVPLILWGFIFMTLSFTSLPNFKSYNVINFVDLGEVSDFQKQSMWHYHNATLLHIMYHCHDKALPHIMRHFCGLHYRLLFWVFLMLQVFDLWFGSFVGFLSCAYKFSKSSSRQLD